LRPELVKSGCSLESRKSPAFYSATIFQPNTRGEFFNRIGRLAPVASSVWTGAAVGADDEADD
jgi:hypothetical protein